MSYAPDSVPQYVGSIHKYSDGYGYGIRVPTARNMQTKPAAVPQMRYAPESSRYTEGTKCTPLIKNDEKAHRRLADQMVMQTSGEYGKFIVDTDSKAVKLNSGKIPTPNYKYTTTKSDMFATKETAERFESARLGTPLEFKCNQTSSDFYSNARSSGTLGINNGNTKTQYTETLKSLDSQFDRQSRKDLFAASLPSRSNQEQLWVVTGAHHSAQKSQGWSGNLRHSSGNR